MHTSMQWLHTFCAKALHTYYFCPRNFGMSKEMITFAYPKTNQCYEPLIQISSKIFAAYGAERGNAPALANTEKRRTPKGCIFI